MAAPPRPAGVGSHWTIDFLGKKLPHYVVHSGRSFTVCAIRDYDPETSCFRVYGLNLDKARFPDFDIYFDEISEMHFVKTVVLNFTEEKEESLAIVAPEIADALEEFFTWHPDQEEVDYLLWRMFFNALRYDMEKTILQPISRITVS